MRATGLVRLTRDPDLRDVEVDGERGSVCTMRCAIRSRRGRNAGFIDVVAWGVLGQRCAEYLMTGSLAFVDGQLKHQEWTADDGAERDRHSIVADDVQFLGRPAAPVGPVIVDGVEF
jgi:single-strand DNA-binding protein